MKIAKQRSWRKWIPANQQTIRTYLIARGMKAPKGQPCNAAPALWMRNPYWRIQK